MFSEKLPVQFRWNITFYRHSGRLFYNTRHRQQVKKNNNNNVIAFQNTKLGLPFLTRAPSPTNSTRTWVQRINNSDQPPPNPRAVENPVACHMTWVTGWLQTSKAPKDVSPTSQYSSQVIKDFEEKNPRRFLPFLAKCYLYFEF